MSEVVTFEVANQYIPTSLFSHNLLYGYHLFTSKLRDVRSYKSYCIHANWNNQMNSSGGCRQARILSSNIDTRK